MFKCICGKEFKSIQAFNGHKSHCVLNAQAAGKSIDKLKAEEAQRAKGKKDSEKIKFNNLKKKQLRIEKEHLAQIKWINEKHVCEKCGKIMTEKFGLGRFCCRKCANSRSHTLEENRLKSIKMKENYRKNPNRIICPSPTNIRFTSRAEQALIKYLKTNHPDDSFTHSHLVKYDGICLNPDIYSKKLKVVIEYDGDWHFIDIKGQLQSKQYKDKILKKFILESDYRLIRIDERYKFTYEEIDQLIYNSQNKITLLGDRYAYLNE